MKRFVIAVYVENKYGVLARVSGMFMRKGFNIDSLTVGVTDDPAFSRIAEVSSHEDSMPKMVISMFSYSLWVASSSLYVKSLLV